MAAKPALSARDYAEGVLSGDRVMLGRAITLIESARPEHRLMARDVIQILLAHTGQTPTRRVGVTGAPGAGKSTLIEALGLALIEQKNARIAVLAVDPSSALSKGSILGDKTRMEKLSVHPQAFIRPSPAGTHLGGVARQTRETLLLVEAAGYDHILIETVGVGQSEIAVQRMTDLLILLLIPGAGDELQGIKRGIVEMADLLVVNKAEGERLKLARQAQMYYLNAVRLSPPKPGGLIPKVLACSALEGLGIDALLEALDESFAQLQRNNYLQENRRMQTRYWFSESLRDGLMEAFYGDMHVKDLVLRYEQQVTEGRISPFAAAADVLAFFWEKRQTAKSPKDPSLHSHTPPE